MSDSQKQADNNHAALRYGSAAIYVDVDELCKHTWVFGPARSGKTPALSPFLPSLALLNRKEDDS